MPRAFPASDLNNVGLYNAGAGSGVPFSVLMIDCVPDRHVTGAGSGGNFYPRYTFEKSADDGGFDFGEANESGYHRIDNITDAALKGYRSTYGERVTKDEIFYYVYGLLHSPTYRNEFAADLRKMLPRIPKVKDFAGFTDAGRKLADLHLNYETVAPHDLAEIVTGSGGDDQLYRVQKMAFGKGKTAKEKDRTRIVYNSRITVAGIPEAAYRYMLGSRSAIEWIMDRYQVKTDKASGIANDPNDWSREVGEPRYILDLLARIVTVSLDTMEVVDNLPPLDIIETPKAR